MLSSQIDALRVQGGMRERFDDVTLSGDGFSLRPLSVDDIADITAACQDDSTQYWLPLPRPYTPQAAQGFITQMAPAALDSGDGIIRAIDIAGRLHGVIDFKSTNWPGADTEIGYWVAPWGRGNGLAGRAARLLADWALTTQDIARVTIYAASGNVASQKAAIAAGFVHEGTKRSGGVTHHGRVDLELFGKIRSDIAS